MTRFADTEVVSVIRRKELVSRQIRHVQVVVVGVRDEDADDAKLLRIQRSCPVVRPSFELYLPC